MNGCRPILTQAIRWTNQQGASRARFQDGASRDGSPALARRRAVEERQARAAAEAAAAKRHAEHIAQLEAARGSIVAYTDQIAHLALAMGDVTRELKYATAENAKAIKVLIQELADLETYTFQTTREPKALADRGLLTAGGTWRMMVG